MRSVQENKTKEVQKLEFSFAVERVISARLAFQKLYEGMILNIKRLEASDQLALTACFEGDQHVVGMIPVGMNHHLHAVIQDEEDLCIELHMLDCRPLSNRMWINITALSKLSIESLTS